MRRAGGLAADLNETLELPLDPNASVAYSSDAACLAYGTMQGFQMRLRLRRLGSGSESWVDQTASGGAPNGPSFNATIDANCTHVAFVSHATDLHPAVDQPHHVFRRNLNTQALDWVSQRSNGEPATETFKLVMSPDGRHFVYDRTRFDPFEVWFEHRDMLLSAPQRAPQLAWEPIMIDASGGLLAQTEEVVPGDLNGLLDIHVASSPTAPMQLLSSPLAAPPIMSSNGASYLSTHRAEAADGRWVAFESLATNLLFGVIESDTLRDVYLRDRQTGDTERALASFAITPNRDVHLLDFSRDGRYLLLWSCANNLAANDTNGHCDVFVADRLLHQIERANVDSAGNQSNFESSYPVRGGISDDGRFVVFDSLSPSLVPSDDIGGQTYVRDRLQGTTTMAMQGTEPLDASTDIAWFAPGGAYLVVYNSASNAGLSCYQVGIDLLTGERECPLVDQNGTVLHAALSGVSADARFVVYADWEAPLPAVYIRDRQAGSVRQFPLDTIGLASDRYGYLSGNGRYLVVLGNDPSQAMRTGVYDLILGTWVKQPAIGVADTFSMAINFGGTALLSGTGRAVVPADQNGLINDIYRFEYRGDGIFGGGWQGGFD